ncbi:MAG: hypothetical protein WC406_07760 [Methanoregula sp.]
MPRSQRGVVLRELHRTQVSITSYSDDSIRTVVETCADGVTALA